ncbi:MAG TPA: FAD-dependent oxidoreductase [Steroidobacteraceae bacterium]|nr:FAD-dependent oxidoreductase [Steroidobacteraceae bacterium]
MPTVAAADFIVIGAGIAGASVAWRLAPRGRVVLLEAEHRPGYHSTGRSAAMFDRAYGNATIRALTAASHEFFLDHSRLGLDEPLLTPRGALYVARADQFEQLERHYESIRALAPEARMHDGEFARATSPILREGLFARCVWDPSSSDIDVARMHDALLSHARRLACEFLRSAQVERIERRGSNWHVEAGGRAFEAPVVVNAAGAWADDVAQLAGLAPLGLQPRRRSIAVVPLPESLDPRRWPLTIDVEETWYFKGEAGRLLVSPADETDVAPCDASVDDEVLAAGIARFEAATTVEVRRVTSSWAGLRSFFPDRSPVLGPDPRAPGFFWCAGLGGYGIQTAPAVSALVASTVVGQPAADAALLAQVSAARFLPGK